MSAPPPYSSDPNDDPSKQHYQPGAQAPYAPQHAANPQPYPPYQSYQNQPPQPPATAIGGQSIVVTVPTVTVGQVGGCAPVQVTCPNCHQTVVTTVTYDAGALTWLLCVLLCVFGCWLCACIPFCVDDCQDAVHTCPSCGIVVGRFRRL